MEAEPDPQSPETGAGPTGLVVGVALVAALGGFLFGYDSAVINGAITAIGKQFAASPGALGLAVSAALLGAAAGALMAGRIGDHYGRLFAMRTAAVLFVVSAIGSGLAGSLLVLALFRVLGGVAVGMASVIAPAYIAEISPADMRGRLGSLQQLAIVSGIFLSLLVDYAVAAGAGGSQAPWFGGLEAWRWMFIAMVVPATIYGVMSFTIPESPRQLLAKGRIDEAREVLKRVLGERGLAANITRIRQSLETDREPHWSDLRGPALGLLPVVWVGIGLSVFQQFVGINVIFYYSSVLWEAVGFSEKNSLIITVITSVVNVVTTVVAILLIDRWGRRPLLLVGSAGMAVTLGILAFVFGGAPLDAAGQPHLPGSSGVIALFAANAYVFAFGMSWGPVVWVLLGEKFPNRIRAAALAVAASAQWIANWAISTSFPVLKNAGLGLAYGLYCTFAVLSFFFVWRFVRESKGSELEDADDQLLSGVPKTAVPGGGDIARLGLHGALAALALTLLPVCANAQRVSPSPAASPSAAPSPLGTANPAALKAPKIAGLLGDFGDGARSSLAEHGLTLNGHLVTEAAANLSGGVPLGGTAYGRGTAVSSEFGFGFDLDFDKLYRDSGAGTFHFLLTTRFGSNLSSEAIGNLASVEEIYGDGQTTRVTFLDYEQPLAKGRFDLRLGKYNQQNDFIAGSTYWGGNLYCFYQNNNICGTPAGIPINNGVVANGSEGYTYYPVLAMGRSPTNQRE